MGSGEVSSQANVGRGNERKESRAPAGWPDIGITESVLAGRTKNRAAVAHGDDPAPDKEQEKEGECDDADNEHQSCRYVHDGVRLIFRQVEFGCSGAEPGNDATVHIFLPSGGENHSQKIYP